MCGKKNGIVSSSVVLALGLCFSRGAVAADSSVIAPVSAAASSTYLDDPGFVAANYLIDGSGLTSTGTIWEAVHSLDNAGHLFWHSNTGINVAAQWLEFDLGAAYDVTNALVWQLAQKDLTSRGVCEFRISVAGTNHSYSLYSQNVLGQATNTVAEPVQVLSLIAKDVRFIRFEILSNWGAGEIVGLSEVRFEVRPATLPPAERMIVPLSATASSTYDTGFCGSQYLVDGSGMKGTGHLATHSNQNTARLFWHSAIGYIAGEWLEFDLGATYDVTNALIWQLAQETLTSRGVRGFSISVAGPDHAFTTYSTGNELRQALGQPEEPVQIVPLVASNVRYIRIDIQSNWGDGIVVGLSEVRFEVAPPQPNSAAVALAPVAASVSSYYGYGGDYYAAQDLIDGSGLTGSGRTATHTDYDGWKLFWHSDVNIDVSAQWVEFDLGALYDVTNALVWQLSQNNVNASVPLSQRGVKAFTIKVAGADHAFSTYSTDNVINQASEQTEQFPSVVPLEAKNVRYVRFEIQSNWGASGIVGLNEVQFEVAPPETNAFIRIPVGDQVSSSYVASKGFLIDGSGLTGTGLAATHGDGLGEDSMWLSNYGTIAGQWVEFDLGAELKLVSAAVWQYNQTQGGDGSLSAEYLKRGVKNMTVLTAGNDKNYTEYGSFQLARATGLAAEPAQLVPLKVSRARYVKFAVNSNWGFPDMVGLSEVRFLYERTGTLLSIR